MTIKVNNGANGKIFLSVSYEKDGIYHIINGVSENGIITWEKAGEK